MPKIRHKESGKIYFPIGDPILGIIVTAKGLFSLPYFYDLTHEWFIENKWATRLDMDFGETFFCQRDSGKHSEIWARWQFKKPAPDPLFHFELDYQIHVMGMTNKETVIKGKKLKLQHAEMEVKFNPRIVVNPLWEKSKLFKGLQKWYLKKLVEKKIEPIRKDFYREMMRLQDAIKSYFDIKTFMEIPENQEFYTKTTEEMI